MRFLFALTAWVGFCFFAKPAFASKTTFRNAHPVGWMHLLPVGETPGWNSRVWLNFELNHANVWNNEFEMTDMRNQKTYTYKADFEQTSAIAEMGLALSEDFALSLEVPYANRNGGFLDDFIDQFHVLIGSDRFLRHLNDPFENSFVIREEGLNVLGSEKAEGVGGFKAKLKWWPLKWRSETPGLCDCGLAFSAQVKFPVMRRLSGISTGENDYSALVHLGIPLFSASALWMTSAVTKLGTNENFREWPRREWLQMYEMSLDIGIYDSFGLLFQVRTESPVMMKEHLKYNYDYTDPKEQLAERVASGWNSLVHWRGSQGMGFRWRWGEGSQINFLIVEDWAFGHQDGRSDFLYVNNAPDVAFLMQFHFLFGERPDSL